ncbi:MAG: hypothetical protein R3E66_17420 [bacterium]
MSGGEIGIRKETAQGIIFGLIAISICVAIGSFIAQGSHKAGGHHGGGHEAAAPEGAAAPAAGTEQPAQ